MQDESVPGTEQKVRMEWIEPEVRQLDISETAFRPGTGGDGEQSYADCTLS